MSDIENNKNDDKISNLKFIYGEACKTYEQQQSDIKLLNNKFNWITVLDVFALGVILKSEYYNDNFIIISLVLFFISLTFSVMSLWCKNYARGPLLTDMLGKQDNLNHEDMISGTNKVLIESININKKTVLKMSWSLQLSIFFLMVGFLFLIISFL